MSGATSTARMDLVTGEMKGVALVRTPSSSLRQAEVHWYEAHGVGKRDFKIKRYLDIER